jgi:hypothetical protein
MAQPIIGKAEFKRTADGQILLIVDPDSTWEVLKIQMPGSPSNNIMTITTDNRIVLNNNRFLLLGGQLGLGGNGTLGGVYARNLQGNTTASLFASGELTAGGVGQAGKVCVTNASGGNTILLDGSAADLFLGGANQSGTVVLRNATGMDSIRLEGQTGDINLLNADCAEDFDILESEEIDPGTVMVINDDGQLQPSKDEYDKRVAGVLSGAGDYRPGIVLDKKPSRQKRRPLALVGKVYCKVDAQYSAIMVGDLLTTSPTPGHAMKARDPFKAFGAVIGKALRALKEGHGLIPILVALQ